MPKFLFSSRFHRPGGKGFLNLMKGGRKERRGGGVTHFSRDNKVHETALLARGESSRTTAKKEKMRRNMTIASHVQLQHLKLLLRKQRRSYQDARFCYRRSRRPLFPCDLSFEHSAFFPRRKIEKEKEFSPACLPITPAHLYVREKTLNFVMKSVKFVQLQGQLLPGSPWREQLFDLPPAPQPPGGVLRGRTGIQLHDLSQVSFCSKIVF